VQHPSKFKLAAWFLLNSFYGFPSLDPVSSTVKTSIAEPNSEAIHEKIWENVVS
jgi:hypothetical protein